MGVIDGFLVWTEKPSEAEAAVMKCGSKRFLCGRKNKFGFNMQAICDSHCRFLKTWINNPASSADFLAFVRSKFFNKLNTPGFIKKDHVLFGDL